MKWHCRGVRRMGGKHFRLPAVIGRGQLGCPPCASQRVLGMKWHCRGFRRIVGKHFRLTPVNRDRYNPRFVIFQREKEGVRMIVNSRSIGTLAALAMFCLAPVRGIRAQGAAGAAAAPSKIAVINIRNAIVATAEGKLAQAQLQSQFAPKQNELQGMQRQIEDLQQKLSNGARTLSDDEKAKMQRDGEMLTRRLQRGNDDLNEELQAAQSEIVDGIG